MKRGELLLEIETSKAVLEIESQHDGVLQEIVVKPGQSVPVKTVVGIIGTESQSIPYGVHQLLISHLSGFFLF